MFCDHPRRTMPYGLWPMLVVSATGGHGARVAAGRHARPVGIVPRHWVTDAVRPTAPRVQPVDDPDSVWTFSCGSARWITEDPYGHVVAMRVWNQHTCLDPAAGGLIANGSSDDHVDENEDETIGPTDRASLHRRLVVDGSRRP